MRKFEYGVLTNLLEFFYFENRARNGRKEVGAVMDRVEPLPKRVRKSIERSWTVWNRNRRGVNKALSGNGNSKSATKEGSTTPTTVTD
ncbi:hypothetical protein [Bacillus alkalicellulosilyticus]|uniref:hypothetical protein n=1 Tax=Alkalihalobacterium alkalicellulosilyticum TaxID=1912214 RepID=UPI0009980319|nr:hypothetical protein [Bacillus alkalicellulosilyticus]